MLNVSRKVKGVQSIFFPQCKLICSELDVNGRTTVHFLYYRL